MANVFLDLLHKLDVTTMTHYDEVGTPMIKDLTSFGNSNGTFSI